MGACRPQNPAEGSGLLFPTAPGAPQFPSPDRQGELTGVMCLRMCLLSLAQRPRRVRWRRDTRRASAISAPRRFDTVAEDAVSSVVLANTDSEQARSTEPPADRVRTSYRSAG